jgi:hypothetical protein
VQKLDILPEARSVEFPASPPAKKLERSPSPRNAEREWALAIIQGNPFPFMSQFDYAVLLTELCLLVCLAIRTGQPIVWDQKTSTAIDNPVANQLVKSAEHRKG